jgi:hypothetical protein
VWQYLRELLKLLRKRGFMRSTGKLARDLVQCVVAIALLLLVVVVMILVTK